MLTRTSSKKPRTRMHVLYLLPNVYETSKGWRVSKSKMSISYFSLIALKSLRWRKSQWVRTKIGGGVVSWLSKALSILVGFSRLPSFFPPSSFSFLPVVVGLPLVAIPNTLGLLPRFFSFSPACALVLSHLAAVICTPAVYRCRYSLLSSHSPFETETRV